MLRPYTDNMYRKFCEFMSRMPIKQIDDSLIIFREQLFILGTIILDLDDNTLQIRNFIWKCSLCSTKEYIVGSDLSKCSDIFYHLNLQEVLPVEARKLCLSNFLRVIDFYESICDFECAADIQNIECHALIEKIDCYDFFTLEEKMHYTGLLEIVFHGEILSCTNCGKFLIAEDPYIIINNYEYMEGKRLVALHRSFDCVMMHKLEHIMDIYRKEKLTCKTRQKQHEQPKMEMTQ